MENTRPILYGVAGYAEIRQVNAWFIDRILISTSSRRGERDVNDYDNLQRHAQGGSGIHG